MNATKTIPDDILDHIRSIVGGKGVITEADDMAPLLKSWRDNWAGRVPMIVQPANTAELAAVIKLCHDTGTRVVPQGGNTGLTGASQPHDDNSEIIVSTSRMNRIGLMSALSTSTVSTRVARTAGTQPAIAPTAMKTDTAASHAPRSVAPTP